MKYDPVQIVVLAFAPLLLRTGLYLLACKIRSIHISVMSCFILAGSGVFLSIIPNFYDFSYFSLSNYAHFWVQVPDNYPFLLSLSSIKW